MKNYPHIAQKLFYEPLVITPQRHAILCQFMESAMAGTHMTPSQQARTGDEEPDNEVVQVGKTVIIPVHGTIVRHASDIAMSECGCALEELDALIDMAEADTKIKTVIYDFRTPGGSVTGVPETGRKILHSRKETIAFTGDQCCSGGIWLASQCQRFYATQSSQVGSVGVYNMCMDATAALKKEGIKVNAIFAGKYKLLGAYWKPLAEEERAILQARVDKIYGQFKEAMESHRLVEDEHFGNGLVFDGEDAAKIGFTDGVVESLEEVLDGMV